MTVGRSAVIKRRNNNKSVQKKENRSRACGGADLGASRVGARTARQLHSARRKSDAALLCPARSGADNRAAIFKTVRLTGGFEVRCADERLQDRLDNFIRNVPVGGNQCGLESFVSTYFEQLLTCGTAVGEMVTDSDGHIAALFNSPLENIELRRASDGVGVDIFSASCVGMPSPVRRPELVLLSVLNPQPGEVCGCSMLKGLPFVSGILMKIYKTIGLNWERMGNIRFAVTYKPQNDSLDRAYAKERAMQVAKEWSEAMQTGGAVKDFVAVGDVQIKVIGADNQILDSEVPVRQMLEQIVAKTGLPPFMLGLSWSSTERMSTQQADVLTSEIGAYIARTQLSDAVDVLINGDGNDNAASNTAVASSGKLTYTDLVNFWNLFDPYELNTIIAAPAQVAQMLGISEFRDAAAGLNFHATGEVITPLGADLIKGSCVPAGKIIGIDRSCALEMVTTGPVSTEYDKLIDRQLERAVISSTSGFARIFDSAARTLTV